MASVAVPTPQPLSWMVEFSFRALHLSSSGRKCLAIHFATLREAVFMVASYRLLAPVECCLGFHCAWIWVSSLAILLYCYQASDNCSLLGCGAGERVDQVGQSRGDLLFLKRKPWNVVDGPLNYIL